MRIIMKKEVEIKAEKCVVVEININKDGSGIENDNMNDYEERNKRTRIKRFQS